MTTLRIILDGDGAFPEAKPANFGVVSAVSRLAGGMQSGRTSVCIEIVLRDGSSFYGEASLMQLSAAMRAFETRDEMDAQQLREARPS